MKILGETAQGPRRPARTPRQPSNQPPFGTESRWLPSTRAPSESPRSVVHEFPPASEVVFYRKPFQLALKPLPRLKPGRTPRDALRAIRIGRQVAKLLKVQRLLDVNQPACLFFLKKTGYSMRD